MRVGLWCVVESLFLVGCERHFRPNRVRGVAVCSLVPTFLVVCGGLVVVGVGGVVFCGGTGGAGSCGGVVVGEGVIVQGDGLHPGLVEVGKCFGCGVNIFDF